MLSHQLKIPETNNGIAYWSLPSLNYLNHHKTHQAMLANFTSHLRLQVTVRMLLMFVQKIYAGAQCKTTKMTWHTSKQSSSSNSSLTFLHMPACCNVHLKSTIQFHQQIKINLPPSPLKLKKKRQYMQLYLWSNKNNKTVTEKSLRMCRTGKACGNYSNTTYKPSFIFKGNILSVFQRKSKIIGACDTYSFKITQKVRVFRQSPSSRQHTVWNYWIRSLAGNDPTAIHPSIHALQMKLCW